MEALTNKLKKYSVVDCYGLEEDSKEFANLWEVYKNINNKDFFLPLVLSSSLVLYSISMTSEKYWETLSIKISEFNFSKIDDIYLFFIDFLPTLWINDKSISKKIIKLKQIRPFLDDLYFKQTYFHKNMLLLSKKIAEYSEWFFDDDIVVFTVRMYAYWARVRFNKHIAFPEEFLFVVNSDFISLYKRYDWEFKGNSEEFYLELSQQLEIPPMHLETLLLSEYTNLMELNISSK